MELTAWQKICHRILGKAFKNRARNDKELCDDLIKGNIPVMPEVYMAQVFVTTITVAIICGLIITGFFLPEIGFIDWYEDRPDESTAEACFLWEYWNPDLVDPTKVANGCPEFRYLVFPAFAKAVIPIVLGLLIPFLTFKYQKGAAARSSKFRGKKLEKYLPYAASYTAAMAAANAIPSNIFKSQILLSFVCAYV